MFIENKIKEHLVKFFLDVIVLSIINGESKHGYGIIADIHLTFGVLFSPGTLYPLLYDLEKRGLIEVREKDRKKEYKITPKGRRLTLDLVNANRKEITEIFNFIERRFV